MKNASKRKAFIFISILMFVAGIAAIFAGVVIMTMKLADGDAKKMLIVLATGLSLVYGILEIVVGISSLSERKKLANQSRTVSITKLVIIFCLVQIIISSFNGILVWQLAVVFVIGILIPVIYLIISKRGRVIRPTSKGRKYEKRK